MYKDKPEPAPTTNNPDGSLNVLVELRPGSQLPALDGCQLDESYEAVPMEGGTTIVRCRVRDQHGVRALEQKPEVAAVWPETPIAPMTPS
jgi:hypothetical protein